jgi:hypothetical protein
MPVVEPETLLHLPSGASAPQFSPDGSLLACAAGGVWIRSVEDAIRNAQP